MQSKDSLPISWSFWSSYMSENNSPESPRKSKSSSCTSLGILVFFFEISLYQLALFTPILVFVLIPSEPNSPALINTSTWFCSFCDFKFLMPSLIPFEGILLSFLHGSFTSFFRFHNKHFMTLYFFWVASRIHISYSSGRLVTSVGRYWGDKIIACVTVTPMTDPVLFWLHSHLKWLVMPVE